MAVLAAPGKLLIWRRSLRTSNTNVELSTSALLGAAQIFSGTDTYNGLANVLPGDLVTHRVDASAWLRRIFLASSKSSFPPGNRSTPEAEWPHSQGERTQSEKCAKPG